MSDPKLDEMTMRDLFALFAMQGIITDPEMSGLANDCQEQLGKEVDFFDFCAKTAYGYAEAMLKVREQ